MTIGFTGLKYPIQLSNGKLALSTTSSAPVTVTEKVKVSRLTQKPTTYVSGPDADAHTKLAVADGTTLGSAGSAAYIISSSYQPIHSNITVKSVQLYSYVKGCTDSDDVAFIYKNLPAVPSNTYYDTVAADSDSFNWVYGTLYTEDPEGNPWTPSSALNCHFGVQGGGSGLRVYCDALFKIITYSYNTSFSSNIAPTMAHIEESVLQILKTRTGDRVMLYPFGTNVDTMIFQTNDESMRSMLEFDLRESLRIWEPRISVDSIAISSVDTTATVTLKYTVIAYGLTVDQTVYLGAI